MDHMNEPDIYRVLGRIEGKLDANMQRFEAVDTSVDKLDSRVSKIEQRVWWLAGAAATVGAILAKALSSVGMKIGLS